LSAIDGSEKRTPESEKGIVVTLIAILFSAEDEGKLGE
jgi:hypothetical protein